MNKLKKLFFTYRNIILSAAFLALIIAAFQVSINNAAVKVDESAEKTQYEAIKKAAVQCYALEGFYPPGIDYLIENYGIIVDREKFIIHYEADGENLTPDIAVIPRFSPKGQ